jgi:surfeit locus 1 family protein
LQWKEALIARVEARIHSAPIPAPGPDAWRPFDIERFDYQPVQATGSFLHNKEIHVYAALAEPKGPIGGVGYRVMTPLETTDGWFLLVNRGFVPADRKDAATRPEGQLSGTVTVTGLVRPAEPAGNFTPRKDVARNIWFNRDPAEMAAAMGLPADRVAPYTIDAVLDPLRPGGLPQGGETVVTFPNNHLQYALTWFGLAIALIAVFAVWAQGRVRSKTR